ncbi:hypothetical protein ACHAXT_010438 [Thalassiosira profunda]
MPLRRLPAALCAATAALHLLCVGCIRPVVSFHLAAPPRLGTTRLSSVRDDGANESSDEGRTFNDAAILGETLDIDRRGGTYSWSSPRRTAKEDVRSAQPPSNPTSATKDPYTCIAFDGCGPIVLHQQPGAFLAPNAPDDGASSNESAASRRRSGRTGVALWSAAHVLSHYIDAQWSKGGPWRSDESGASSNPRWRVLELGAGLGLCSAVAAKHGMDVVATDNDPEVLELLAENLERNRIRDNNPSRSVDCRDQQVHVHSLDWIAAAGDSRAEASAVFRQLEALGGADLILLSDVIYGATRPAWEALLTLLSKFRAQRQRLAGALDEDGPSFPRGEPLVLLSYTQRRRDMSPQDEAHFFAMVKAAGMEAVLIPAENVPHGGKYVLTSLFELRWI